MKIKDNNWYYALLYYCSADNIPMICGVYCSKKEAREASHSIYTCPAKHKIKRCKIEVKLNQ